MGQRVAYEDRLWEEARKRTRANTGSHKAERAAFTGTVPFMGDTWFLNKYKGGAVWAGLCVCVRLSGSFMIPPHGSWFPFIHYSIFSLILEKLVHLVRVNIVD